MYTELKLKINRGDTVNIAIMGNSIACGFRAENTYAPNEYNNENFGLLAVGLGTDIYNRVTEAYERDQRINSWSIQLMKYLQLKNPNSQISNVSINGGDVLDHINTNSLAVIEARLGTVDAVIVPLQINESLNWNGPEWITNTRTLIDLIIKKGWLPVLMKENDIHNPISENRPFFYSIMNHVNILADQYRIEVIDAFTPFKTVLDSVNRSWELSGLFYDSIHPNQIGHNTIFGSVKGWLEIANVQNIFVKEINSIVKTSSISIKSEGVIKKTSAIKIKL